MTRRNTTNSIFQFPPFCSDGTSQGQTNEVGILREILLPCCQQDARMSGEVL